MSEAEAILQEDSRLERSQNTAESHAASMDAHVKPFAGSHLPGWHIQAFHGTAAEPHLNL
jgi:hypothetical protein